MQQTYSIAGMHCQACEQKISSALKQVDGVHAASVSLETKTASVDADAGVTLEQLRPAVESAGDYQISKAAAGSDSTEDSVERSWLATYWPLVLIVDFITGGMLIAAWRSGTWEPMFLMSLFMGLFFVVFAFFKLLDLKGFADAYSTYDIIAQRWPGYGYVYPFVELGLGVSYLLGLWPLASNLATLVVMSLSAVGVVRAVMRKSEIQCARLGTVFDLPMTTVTIVEDVSMAVMAAVMIVLLV